MATAVLSSEKHQNLTVDTRAAREFGDLVNRCVILSSEFNEAHKEFPILLHRNSGDGTFVAHAILGLDKDENLFVANERWTTSYVPAMIARGPFSMGYVASDSGERDITDIKVMIEEDSPRLKADGQPLFLPLGGEAPYLEGVKQVLQIIDAGLQADKLIYPLLVEMDLLEEVKIKISLSEEKQFSFSNYFMINQDKLGALSANELLALNQSGALGLAYFMLSSLGNFHTLIRLKNENEGRE